MRAFNLQPNRVIAGKYQVVEKLGSGWEGEVYKIHEIATGVECAAKLFFPERNLRNKTAIGYARKLHALRECPAVLRYHTQEVINWKGSEVMVLIAEYVEGELLSRYLKKQPGSRLSPFQGIHLLHALVCGLESIHFYDHYHGDLHAENVIVRRVGLTYELKFLDLYQPSGARRENIAHDICDAIRIFYDALGGQKFYHKQPVQVKQICKGLKRSLILQEFRDASDLRLHLENQEWD